MKKWILSLLLVYGMAVAAPVDDGMYATLQTTMGDVCFELYYTNAPRTVANFVSLAEGTRPWIDPRTTFISNDPYYDGITFHRVITNFMIQCGSPKGDGTDGPGYRFEDEFDPALRHDRPGMVSMANSGFDSNGGQFFITVKDTSWLDDVHSVFGSVVEGMEVVSNIVAVAVDAGSKPLEDVVITNVFITRNGPNALNFSVTNQALPEVSALSMTLAISNRIHLAIDTADTAYQFVYSSSNLTGWTEAISQYWIAENGAWKLSATLEAREYFHASRAVYTPDLNMTADVTGHRMMATIGTDVFDVSIGGASSGTFIYNSGIEQSLSDWSQFRYPYHLQFIFTANGYVPFRFDLHYEAPASGRCMAYSFVSFFGWKQIGTGTFTDTDLN